MHLTVNFAKNLKVLALIGTAFCATAANAQNTVITADKMIDVLTGKTVDYPAVFVGADGRITSIADARTVKWGSDVTHIKLAGKTILPGLIDMHVHLDGPADIGGYRGLEYTDNFWTVVGVANAKRTLEAGFTTVRNVGSANYDDVALKQGILLERLIDLGAEPVGNTPDQFGAFMKKELARYESVVKASGARVD